MAFCIARYEYEARKGTCSSLISEVAGKQARATENSHNLNRTGTHAVHHSKSTDDNLAESPLVALWDDPTGFGKLDETLDGREDSADKEIGVVW